jgi:hypothetical protein
MQVLTAEAAADVEIVRVPGDEKGIIGHAG